MSTRNSRLFARTGVVRRTVRAIALGLFWAGSIGGLLDARDAHAQIASPCLRPVIIADKWEEAQTPPWDSSDTFSTGDTYGDGFVQPEDQGRPVALQLGSSIGRVFPVRIGADSAGAADFYNDVIGCSGTLREVGEILELEAGNMLGPMIQAFVELINTDPAATWDPSAHDGKGSVIDSLYLQSPRLIALPVYDPAAALANPPWEIAPGVVKIVGFFVSHLSGSGSSTVVNGFLTGVLELSVDSVTAASGANVMLSATVGGPGAPLKGVPVEFSIDGSAVGTALTDEAGAAVLENVVVPALAPGTYAQAISAHLGAPSGFFIADERTADLTILGASTISIGSSPDPSTYGQGTTLTARVSSPTEVPSGTVTFLDGEVVLGTSPLIASATDAVAVLTVSNLDAGGHSLVASYGGSQSLQGSISPPINHDVLASATAVQLTSSPNPSKVGQAVNLQAAVTATPPGGGVPTGVVEFFSGPDSVGTAPLAGGVANLSMSSLKAGKQQLQARYAGTANYETSISNVVTQSVKGSGKR